MSYVLTAVFGRADVVAALVHPLLATPVTLGAGYAMCPVLGPDGPGAEGFDPLDVEAAAEVFGPLAVAASGRAPLAYVHMTMFGGPPDEGVAVWRDGELVWLAAGEDLDERLSAEAFRMIGVLAADGDDEFDTLGLGRHRDTADWIGEP